MAAKNDEKKKITELTKQQLTDIYQSLRTE